MSLYKVMVHLLILLREHHKHYAFNLPSALVQSTRTLLFARKNLAVSVNATSVASTMGYPSTVNRAMCHAYKLPC